MKPKPKPELHRMFFTRMPHFLPLVAAEGRTRSAFTFGDGRAKFADLLVHRCTLLRNPFFQRANAGPPAAFRFLTARFSPHTEPMMAMTTQANETNVQNPLKLQAQASVTGLNKSISQKHARHNTRHVRIAIGAAVSTMKL
jgi:hypothetical protein